jgi:ABC-2 type transport system ATP-binding protein
VLEVSHLTKRYGSTTAIDDLSFSVRDGCVTGFLGPNGAGKSTTMRVMVQLDRPDKGNATFDGKSYRQLKHPLREVGALLDAGYVHPTRTARNHLRAMALTNGIPKARVDTVLELVGLAEVGGKRVGGFSLGMKQRLGLAVALLGDPKVLLFDEPVNGLDPEGILWVRNFMQQLARDGRTVLVSSHLLSEMALTAQDLIVVGRGKLISQGTVDDFVRSASGSWVEVRSPQAEQLAQLVTAQGAKVTMGQMAFSATGIEPAAIGELAAQHGLVLHELSPKQASLEEAFLEVTKGSQEYHSGTAMPGSL